MRKNVPLFAETESKKEIPSLHKNQTIFGDIIQWMGIWGFRGIDFLGGMLVMVIYGC
jgi:hypothetical protein